MPERASGTAGRGSGSDADRGAGPSGKPGGRPLHRESLVEWGEGILPQLAKRFEQSAYLDRQTYAESLERLAALFYHCRAQAGERVTDEQILELLSTRFEGICGGDFERLEELEQEFLQLFPEPLAVRTLLRFDPDYRRQFYNLSGVLLRCVMVTALRQEILGDRTAPSAACLAVWRTTTTPAQQEAKLALLLQQMTPGAAPTRRRCAAILRRNCTALCSSLR